MTKFGNVYQCMFDTFKEAKDYQTHKVRECLDAGCCFFDVKLWYEEDFMTGKNMWKVFIKVWPEA